MALLAANQGIDLWFALIIALLAATALGLVNGLVTTVGRIPSFIVTLGMLYIVRGAALVMSAYPVARLPHETFYEVLAGDLFGIPVQILWMLAIVVVGTLVFRRTTFGYWAQATGSNETAARLAGIPVRRVKVVCFVVIGGTSLFGGHGTIIGTFLGAALLTIVRNGLVQLGGEGRLQEAFLGGIIILAVLIHTHVGRRR
jgi:ribose/xylose/arabinose/galactoside ABC-type transport system permease subunit